MRHFINLGSYTQPKNKLQVAIKEWLKTQDAHIIHNLSEFIADVKEVVTELNEKHPQCRPLTVKDWELTNGKGVALGFGELWTCSVYLYKIREGE
jgi:hypothetical protein